MKKPFREPFAMKTFRHCLLSLVLFWAASVQAAYPGGDAALVTALDGTVNRLTAAGREPVQAFVKLKPGDKLTLESNARIQLVFFESKRQESWGGSGSLEIASAEAKGSGLPAPQVKTLPDILVRQIAKTPALDSQGRAGVVRLRAIPTPEALAKLDQNYQQLRQGAEKDDLNPELFLLVGLLEMRQLDRIEQVLADLQATHPGNMEAKVLVALYQKTLKNLRESGK
jgi:hypothetical protein